MAQATTAETTDAQPAHEERLITDEGGDNAVPLTDRDRHAILAIVAEAHEHSGTAIESISARRYGSMISANITGRVVLSYRDVQRATEEHTCFNFLAHSSGNVTVKLKDTSDD
jgi:hypothetical protein